MTRGRFTRQAFITRDQVRANPRTVFVFGDNMDRRGFGGQARNMRGEPNAIGVPTKWRPERTPSSYFTDADYDDLAVWHAINGAFDQIEQALSEGRDVVIPSDGLGTGLAELPQRAPRIHRAIAARIAALEMLR